MPEHSSRPVLRDEFRKAMRRLATTVSVVSATEGEQRYGITATAVTSLAVDPASLVICINRNTSVHGPILSTSRFCVSMLREHQSCIAQTFGGLHQGNDRFASGDWMDGPARLPYLRDAQANLFCTVDQSVPYASHTIFIGRVTDVRVGDNVSPLLYCDGAYTAPRTP